MRADHAGGRNEGVILLPNDIHRAEVIAVVVGAYPVGTERESRVARVGVVYYRGVGINHRVVGGDYFGERPIVLHDVLDQLDGGPREAVVRVLAQIVALVAGEIVLVVVPVGECVQIEIRVHGAAAIRIPVGQQ